MCVCKDILCYTCVTQNETPSAATQGVPGGRVLPEQLHDLVRDGDDDGHNLKDLQYQLETFRRDLKVPFHVILTSFPQNSAPGFRPGRFFVSYRDTHKL
jgi:hypothetical protein